MLRLLVCTFLFFTVTASSALAQDAVGVRTGAHADYSRLVFDWKTKVPYTVESRDAGKLVIKFDRDASIASIPAAMGNMKGLVVLSEKPLRVSIDIPENSRTREFLSENKVVIDIYNPAGTPPPPAPETQAAVTPPPVAEKPPEQKSAEPKPAETAAVPPAPVEPEPAPAETKPDGTKPTEELGPPAPQETPPAPAVTAQGEGPKPELVEDEDEAAPPEEEELTESSGEKPRKSQGRVVPNVIMFSSMEAQSMGVFEMNGEVWMVNDKPEEHLTPQISGPDARELELQSAPVMGGTIFKTKLPKDMRVYGQGGGLLWRVLVTEARFKRTPARPVRKGVDATQPRSGSIIWPLKNPGKVIEVKDPVTGALVKVVTVADGKQFSGPAMEFVDFRTLNTAVGIAIVPKVDDLEIKLTQEGVEISRPGGLALTSEESLMDLMESNKARQKEQLTQSNSPRVFDFGNWQLGGVKALDQNRNIIMNDIGSQSESERIEGVMTLAKMYLANAQGSEALGFLHYIEDELPALAENAQFIALRGAAQAIDWKSEAAFEDLSHEGLDKFEEIGYWKAYVLADLGDWSQAEDVMPDSFSTLYGYSAPVFNRLALVLAEVCLRAGDVKKADQLLNTLEETRGSLFEPQKASLDYLKGEAARQKNDVVGAKKFWEPLGKGKDDLYRAKAGLALTRLRVDQKELTLAKSVDNLERLRYVWRGDELEGQINYWLGKTYFDVGDYAKGMNIMREAAVLTADTDFGKRITGEMTEQFAGLFLGPELEKISALDAGALYEQFSSLLPEGPEHDKVVHRLAERLVQGDLLGRAGDLLVNQLENRLEGQQAYDIAVRLAAIYLLDGETQKATKVLDQAAVKLEALPEELKTPERFREISLLRARALSRQGRPDQALALLNDMEKTPDVNRLRADTAWYAGYWDDTAEALEDVIIDQNISLTRPLNAENTGLILQRAVALNLAGDRVALANMREKYSDVMLQTDKSKIFEVITRPRKSGALADRETLMGIVSEVDLFKEFLNSYKTVQAPSN